MIGLLSRRPNGLGLKDGRLALCPNSPNCVCSCGPEADRRNHIEPLRFTDSASEAWQRLLRVVERQPRARVVTRGDNYLHAEFTTALLRFVDDVEFQLDAIAGVIHVRSASRLGRSDFGTNRRRVEALRAEFEAEK